MKQKLPQILLVIYVIYFIILGIKPYDRSVWIAENVPVLLLVFVLAITYRKFRFSDISYLFMAFFIFMHTLGGHYTFERVPFNFVTDLFGFSRNNFDRISHFSVGFYAYPIAEYLSKRNLSSSKIMIVLFGIFCIFTVASVYEIIEWIYAVSSAPEQGQAFLGSQGDIWDAQKDMLSDGLGAIFSSLVFLFVYKKEKVNCPN